MHTDVPNVTTAHGELRGTEDHGVAAYLGIPYAAPPFGPRRLMPPEPAPAWEGVRDATAYGPTAPKAGYAPAYADLLPDPVIPGEDCLNLNVWTPDPKAVGLPVFVWIHGGSFVNGSGAVDAYRGSSFARDGVVCVSINYRLQVEGFLYADGVNDVGLLDQVAALEWVRDNIAAFGGDPAKVTVGGESAGAMSVTTLLSMPRAAGLFRGAITQSGAAFHTMPPELAQRVTTALAAELGVEPTRAALAALPPEALYTAAVAVTRQVQTSRDPVAWGELTRSLLPFMPTVDGDVVPRAPLPAIADGAGAGVALLTGTTGEEYRFFLVGPGFVDAVDEATLKAGVAAYDVDPGRAIATYTRPGDSPGDVLAAIMTDWFFAVPSIRVAEARGDGSPTWMYRFDHRSPARDGRLGAAHATEIGFVFDTLDAADTSAIFPDPPQVVADTMHAAWVAFVRDLDPGWPAYDTARRTTMIFGETDGPVEHPRAERYAVWDGVR